MHGLLTYIHIMLHYVDMCVCVCRRGKRRIGDNYRLKCVHAGGLGIWEGGDHCELK